MSMYVSIHDVSEIKYEDAPRRLSTGDYSRQLKIISSDDEVTITLFASDAKCLELPTTD